MTLSRPALERIEIPPRDLRALSALGYTDVRISTMDLDEVDLILFNRLQATAQCPAIPSLSVQPSSGNTLYIVPGE